MTLTSHHLRTMLERKPTKRRVHPVEFIARSIFYFALGFCLAITISEAFKAHRQTADKFRPPTILQSTHHQCPAQKYTCAPSVVKPHPFWAMRLKGAVE